MIATFQDSAWDLKEFSDGNVKATISSDKRRLCMTTVPYDPDWTVRVNGKSVKTKSVVNGMMAFHVPKGKSTITMHYRLAGQKKGIAITIVAVYSKETFLSCKRRDQRNTKLENSCFFTKRKHFLDRMILRKENIFRVE